MKTPVLTHVPQLSDTQVPIREMSVRGMGVGVGVGHNDRDIGLTNGVRNTWLTV